MTTDVSYNEYKFRSVYKSDKNGGSKIFQFTQQSNKCFTKQKSFHREKYMYGLMYFVSKVLQERSWYIDTMT